MKYDTAGNEIYEPIENCNCGLTGGCKRCNNWGLKMSELEKEQQKLNDWKRRFDENIVSLEKIMKTHCSVRRFKEWSKLSTNKIK